MRVCVEVIPSHLSKAMHRVAEALKLHAPDGVTFVSDPAQADLQVMHVVNKDQIGSQKAPQYAVMQYVCGDGALTLQDAAQWKPFWGDAVAIWSYYDLQALVRPDKFYFAPMGVGAPFTDPYEEGKRDITCVTSGYVDGPPAEAISAVAHAALNVGGRVAHIGPVPENMPDWIARHPRWQAVHGLTDAELAIVLRRAMYVSGLRYLEGFEMMTVEGAACGAVPIMFDRADSWRWDRGAEHVPEDHDKLVPALTGVFSQDAKQVLSQDAIKFRYGWEGLVKKFWQKVLSNANPVAATVSAQTRRRRLLWIGDAVAATGFAKCTHETLKMLQRTWDVSVLGLNYLGDPHKYSSQYDIYPAYTGGDMFGVGRTGKLCMQIKPDAVVIQNDPWNINAYLDCIPKGTAVVAAMPVDGNHFGRAKDLTGINLALFWTKHGEDEARKGGLTAPSTVIPLGVDANMFQPMDQKEARKIVGLGAVPDGAFIVGNLNRNQPRKRLDLTVKYFCEWVKKYERDDAYLFLHVAPTGEYGYDVQRLMKYYMGPDKKRLILAQPEVLDAPPEQMVRATLACFDVQMSTTQGEGWGLTTMEGMACGIPQIVPEWSALGEWARGAAMLIPCTSTACTPGETGAVVGGIADEKQFIDALESMYGNPELRRWWAMKGLEKAHEQRYRWEYIGTQWELILDEALQIPKELPL